MGTDEEATRPARIIADLLLRTSDLLLELRKATGLSHEQLMRLAKKINQDYEEAAQARSGDESPRGEDAIHPSGETT